MANRKYPKPDSCIGCAFYDYDGGFTQIEGSGARHIMLIGEASGHNEKHESLPFRPSAEAGSVLQMALRRAGLQRESLAITNVIRCQPNVGNWLRGNPLAAEAIAHCRLNLDEAIRIHKPKALVALGDTALEALTGLAGKNLTITSVRGFPLESPQYQLPVVASLHPSFIRRMGMSQLDVLTNDLILAGQVADGRLKAESREDVNYVYNPADYTGRALDEWYEKFATSSEPIAVDIETAYSIKQMDDSEVGLEDDAITEIQFSNKPKEALVLSWNPQTKEFARRVLALPNDKWTWNGDIFDWPILRKHGIQINGRSLDLMDAFHCLQPDLPRGLQFVASFFCPELTPWKHLSSTDKSWYCGRDVDSLQRIGRKLLPDLEKRGVARAFYGHIVKLRPILDRMCERGLPIDVDEQIRLRAELEIEMKAINIEIQAMAPKELQSYDPTNGFAQWPKPAQDILTVLELKGKKDLWRDVYKQFQISYEAGGELQRKVVHGIELASGMIYRSFNGIMRWARPLEFNPASSKQMIAYAKFKGYAVPMAARNNGTESEQANEQVILEWAEKHNDDLCKKVIDYKKRQKIIGTYIDGFKPDNEGRVHSTFTFSPASGQLSSLRPNIQNIPAHGEMAQRIRKTIVAPNGHLFVAFDFKSFHGLTMGFNAQDADWMRLCRLDMHSFVGAHLLNNLMNDEMKKKRIAPAMRAQIDIWVNELDGLDGWLQLPDDQLLAKLKVIKKNHSNLRNKQAKPSGLGIQLGLQAKKLYQMNKDSFSSQKQAQEAINTIFRLFPRIPAWQNEIKEKAHRQGYLLSRHGYLRRFFEVKRWDPKYMTWRNGESAEEAIAFLVQNDAFGEIRDRYIELEENGLLEKWSFWDTVHDSLDFLVPEDNYEDAINEIKPILERPSTILIDSKLGAFQADVECKIGRNWGAYCEKVNPDGMREVKL